MARNVEELLKYPELAVELLKLEIEWAFGEFEKKFFGLLNLEGN